MKVMMTGNRRKDLCQSIVQRFEKEGHECVCFSRSNGFDFEKNPTDVISRLIKEVDKADIFINLYANYFFNASVLAHKLFNDWLEKGYSQKRIINVGSTTDRVQRGKRNLYHYEKRILREMSSGHSMLSVWDQAPKVTHLSVGTMQNRSAENPGRKCLSMSHVADYVYWLVSQPTEIHINELSIDPIQ